MRRSYSEFYKVDYSNPCADWDGMYGSGAGYGKSYYDRDFSSGSTKRKHEFTPILLINSTVFNCKHCGAKQEDAKTEFCDVKEDNNDYDIGGWG